MSKLRDHWDYYLLFYKRETKLYILITDGVQFIGSHIADKFVQWAHLNVIRGNVSCGSADNVHPDAFIITGNAQALIYQDRSLLNIVMAMANRSIES